MVPATRAVFRELLRRELEERYRGSLLGAVACLLCAAVLLMLGQDAAYVLGLLLGLLALDAWQQGRRVLPAGD